MKCISFIAAILAIILLLNCEEDKQCTEDIEISVNIDFKTISSGIKKDTLINNLTVIGKDTPYYNTNNLKSISLALSQSSDTSEFRFSVDTVPDTILFYSSRELFMISFECGFATRFILEKVISQDILIDSISIIKSNVDRSDETNVIFFY
jgi:hypothetical protein